MISKETKMNIERVIGVPVEQFINMNTEEERAWIEKKNKAKLSFPKKLRYGVIGRGNPLLARRRIRTSEDLEKKSKKFFEV